MPVRLSVTTPIRLTRGVCVALSVLLSLALCWPGSSMVPALADDCQQPASEGCPLDLNQPVTGVLADASEVHAWRLKLSRAVPLHIALTNLPVDYDVHVYAVDGTLLGDSTNEGTQDDVVDLPDSGAGTYTIYVNSPRGDVSDKPYTLVVSALNTGATAAAANPTPPPPAATAGNTPSARPAPGQVLLADAFDNPAHGWLPTGPSGAGTRNYVGGEYQLLKLDPSTKDSVTAVVPGVYTNSSIAFDARFVDLQTDAGLWVRCRNNGNSGYRAGIFPGNRTVALDRLDGDANNFTRLVPSQPAAVLQRDVSRYHVELSCVGDVISLSINNSPLIGAEDATYSSGNHVIAAGISYGKTSDLRLSNLVVTQR